MDGLVVVDKPAGLSSHDVVARARRVTRIRAIGHAGTLDPMATGVLVLCIGRATRLSEYLLGDDKTYLARIRFGARSSTDDAEGALTPVAEPAFTPEQLRAAMQALLGPILQVPPQVSAIQRDGQRAYALVRQGKTVALDARPVTVHSLVWLDADALADAERWRSEAAPVEITARATVSSGTYIRAIARDLGDALGCGGYLSALRRERAGAFGEADAVALDTFMAAGDRWPQYLAPMTAALTRMPIAHVDAAGEQRIANGQFVPLAEPDAPQVQIHSSGGRLVAVGRIESGLLKPVKVFTSGSEA